MPARSMWPWKRAGEVAAVNELLALGANVWARSGRGVHTPLPFRAFEPP